MNHGGRLTSVQDSSRAAARVGEVGSHVGAGLEPGSCKVGEVREAGGNRDARCGEGGRRRPDGCMSGGHSTHISKFEFLRNGLCFFFLFFFLLPEVGAGLQSRKQKVHTKFHKN